MGSMACLGVHTIDYIKVVIDNIHLRAMSSKIMMGYYFAEIIFDRATPGEPVSVKKGFHPCLQIFSPGWISGVQR